MSNVRTDTEQDPPAPAQRSPPNAGSSLAKYAEHWLLPEAEIRYAETRQRQLFRHYDTEQELISRWLRRCEPGAIVLDIPCGTGRFSELAQSCGHRLVRGDLSYAMVAHARHLGPNQHCLGDLCCDLAMPPLAPASVDIVLVWRLFHHCRTPEDRELVLRQARRLTRRYVIISYYNRASITYWSRRFVRRMLCRAPKCRGAIWTDELLQIASQAGLEPVEIYHYRPGISINSAACFAVVSKDSALPG